MAWVPRGCAVGSGCDAGLGGESPLAKRGGCHGLVTASVAAAKSGHDCANLRFGRCLFDAHKVLQFDIGAYTMPRCFAMANFIFIYFHVEGLTESVSVG